MARVSAGSRRTTTEDFTMKRSLLAIIAIVGMVVIFAATFALQWLHDIKQAVFKQPKPKCHPALVQAKAFVTKLAKRARPTVTPTWRMCPST